MSDMMNDSGLINSRAFFNQVGTTPAPNDVIIGTSENDTLVGDPMPEDGPGLPGALAHWGFDSASGNSFADTRGGPSAEAFRLENGEAVAATDNLTRPGPLDGSDLALQFNGENSFAFINHDPAFEITQGTVALWVQPDDLSDDAIILSKDERGDGDGGHFRLGFEDDGRLFIRVANGDGGSNKAWESVQSYLSEGTWTHLAVSFSADGGVTVYVDGIKVPDFAWIRVEGNEDQPNLQSEAYILQNAEPWILGADTSRTNNNDTPQDFAADDPRLDDPFDGAISDFIIFGGMDAGDVLTDAQVLQLFEEGPGTALTAPAGPEPLLAGDDSIDGSDGHDVIDAGAGQDQVQGGAGRDSIDGGYGDDILDGGDGNDTLDGGRGSDLLLGGDGDDLLIARSDAGEQRIGQLAIGEPSRPDGNAVNYDREKLYGWEDQPLVADDILVGGEGRDTFFFNPQINAKRDIILEHVNEDRTIDWAGVAGENDELHDHWVDSFGIDIIADYRAGEDQIVIAGHTVQPKVHYEQVDTDGDGVADTTVSVITVYSQQGNNGGAHDEDLIGQIVVYGDLVDLDDVLISAKLTTGIVETVDDLQEALAPTGALKTTTLGDGSVVYGYDTRDADGGLGAVTGDPINTSDNPFLTSGLFEFAGNIPDDIPQAAAILDASANPLLAAVSFTGNKADGEATATTAGAYVEVDHIAGLAQDQGTIALSFVADAPGDGRQALVSKDARTYVDGGHFTLWINERGEIEARFQSTNESVVLKARDIDIVAGETYHVAFTFTGTAAILYVNGIQQDVEDLSDNSSFLAGMTGNSESLVLGADTTTRSSGELNNLKEFFEGTISDVVILDRALYAAEVFQLSEGVLDFIPAGSSAGSSGGGDSADIGSETGDDSEDSDGDENGDESDDGSTSDGATEPSGDSEPEPLTLTGNNSANLLEGGAGDDTLSAARGADTLIGGAGDDVLNAGRGKDIAKGQDGDDILNGGNGRDILSGGDGEDELFGGNGKDTLIGGAGDDLLNGGKGADSFRFGNSEQGDDIIVGFDANADKVEVDADVLIELEIIAGNTVLTLESDAGGMLGSVTIEGVELTLDQIISVDDLEVF